MLLELSIGKDRLQLSQHVAEDQAQFGETPSVRRGLIVDLISGLLEKLQSLSALLHEVIHKDAKELILAQGGHVALVNGENQLQVLQGDIEGKE